MRTRRATPDGLFRIWTPDEAAECLDGLSTWPGLYAKLWGIMADVPRPTYHVEESAPGDAIDSKRALAAFWGRLSYGEQTFLNALARAGQRSNNGGVE
jgi:hypothetical protein